MKGRGRGLLWGCVSADGRQRVRVALGCDSADERQRVRVALEVCVS
jgi:hypothetical protein